MQSAIIFQHNFCDNIVSKLHTMADLDLHQVYSIYCYKNYLDDVYDSSIVNGDENNEYEIENIVEKYLDRNCKYNLLYHIV